LEKGLVLGSLLVVVLGELVMLELVLGSLSVVVLGELVVLELGEEWVVELGEELVLELVVESVDLSDSAWDDQWVGELGLVLVAQSAQALDGALVQVWGQRLAHLLLGSVQGQMLDVVWEMGLDDLLVLVLVGVLAEVSGSE